MTNDHCTDDIEWDSDLPDPERTADELAEISRKYDGQLTDKEQSVLNAADHFLRYVLADTEHSEEA